MSLQLRQLSSMPASISPCINFSSNEPSTSLPIALHTLHTLTTLEWLSRPILSLPQSCENLKKKESVIAKRTVKSHRTYMREGGWWNSVIVSVCMNKTWVIYVYACLWCGARVRSRSTPLLRCSCTLQYHAVRAGCIIHEKYAPRTYVGRCVRHSGCAHSTACSVRPYCVHVRKRERNKGKAVQLIPHTLQKVLASTFTRVTGSTRERV